MGEHGKYINTPQTAADMNSILDAVGQEKMVYWGFSYGSLLGQTYAALFPERSHRLSSMVLWISFEWSLKAPMLKSDFTDTQHVLDGFFDECIKAGDKCALSSGGSKSELESATTYGILDHKAMLYGVFRHLYAPKTWYQFANRLAQMIDGNATDAFLAYGFGESSTFQPIGEATDIVEFNDGATGPKHWPQGRDKLQDLIFPYYESSAFAYSHNKANYVRQTWPVPKTHNFAPQNGVKTAHPLLVLSMTYDPVCPLKSAKAATKAFEGLRLVEVHGYGHCSLAMPSKCVAEHVRAFLHDGTLPDKNARCEIDGSYFESPGDDGKVMTLERLHR
ncbi:hypothetical protein ACLOAV_010788 [Pseudogymnoascus australis]